MARKKARIVCHFSAAFLLNQLYMWAMETFMKLTFCCMQTNAIYF